MDINNNNNKNINADQDSSITTTINSQESTVVNSSNNIRIFNRTTRTASLPNHLPSPSASPSSSSSNLTTLLRQSTVTATTSANDEKNKNNNNNLTTLSSPSSQVPIVTTDEQAVNNNNNEEEQQQRSVLLPIVSSSTSISDMKQTMFDVDELSSSIMKRKIYPHYFSSSNIASDSNNNNDSLLDQAKNSHIRKKKLQRNSSRNSVNSDLVTADDSGTRMDSKTQLRRLKRQIHITRYWRVATCLSGFVILFMILALFGFIFYNLFFVKPLVQMDQIQIYKLPLEDSIVGFAVIMDTYNGNWRPVQLNNCTFYATISDVEKQVSYDISQPISIGTNSSSQSIGQLSDTRIRYKVMIDLDKEPNRDTISDVLKSSVWLHASKFFAMKMEGICDVNNQLNYKWNIHVTRNQQYNLKGLKNRPIVHTFGNRAG